MQQARYWARNAPPVLGITILVGLAVFYGGTPQTVANGRERLRFGYFPNVTHAPAVVGMARGDFQKAAGQDTTVEPKVFNDGPSEMEALLAGEIDIGCVGPGPAINTFLKSKGRALKIIAGACSGGAALVARSEAKIATLADLDGKRVAIPQLGGTQDISLRHFLTQQGLRPREQGGTVDITPIKNPDILALFLQGQLDAAWVPEPWASRLVKDAKAHIVVDERDLWPDKKFLTSVIIVRQAYLEQHADQVQAFLRAHLQTIAWLQQHTEEAQQTINTELKRLTSKKLPKDVLQAAWGHVAFTADLDRVNLDSLAQMAAEAGYLPQKRLATNEMLDLRFLENARRSAVAAR